MSDNYYDNIGEGERVLALNPELNVIAHLTIHNSTLVETKLEIAGVSGNRVSPVN